MVVVLFLMNIRAAIVTLVALPLSLVAAAVAMDRFGLTINSMSLGGLAIAIGELVDDAIIDVENVVRRLRENAARADGDQISRSRNGVRQHRDSGSVVFATVIVALVFLPLFMLGGVEGRLLRPLGFAYVVALVASLVALTVTPVRCSYLPRSKTVVAGGEPALTQRLKTAASGFSAGSCITGVCAGRRRGPSRRGDYRRLRDRPGVLARVQRRALTISSVTIPMPSLTDSNALGNALERLLLSVPEVASTARRTGRAELDEHVQGVESAETDVRLQMRDRPRDTVVEEIRQKLSLLPGTNVTVGQPISIASTTCCRGHGPTSP